MGVVVSRSETRGQARVARILLIVVHLVAVATEKCVLSGYDKVDAAIEIVVALGVELLAAIVVQHIGAGMVGRWKRVQIVEGCLVETRRWHYVRRTDDGAGGIQSKLRAGCRIEDCAVVKTRVERGRRGVGAVESLECSATAGAVCRSARNCGHHGQA